MRKVIAALFVTLDGFVSGPDNEMDWVTSIFDEEMGRAMGNDQQAVDTFLLGRVTYQSFVDYWPNMTKEDDPIFADPINHTPKLVFSKTLEDAPWGKYNNARVVKGNFVEEVQKLKQHPGKD